MMMKGSKGILTPMIIIIYLMNRWKRLNKMNNKTKILAGFVINGKGGVDNYLLNFLANVSDDSLQIDFLTNQPDIDDTLQKRLAPYNAKVFSVARLWHPVKQYKQVTEILKREKYDMVYFNISTAMECIATLAAWRGRIPRRILHSHSAGIDCESTGKRRLLNALHHICKSFLYRWGNEYYACSKKAGYWLYPKKIVDSDNFHVIYNAVDRDRFCFSPTRREKMRKELALENKFVIGHVGTFCYQKNHFFLIDIFEKLHEKRSDAILLLVGEGPRYDEVKRIVDEKKLTNSVLFLGWRNDVAELFQAMDVFLLPSNFEGLPTVGIEAQCAGVPCVFSDTITDETMITNQCQFIPLSSSPEKWSNAIIQLGEQNRGQMQLLPEAVRYDLENQKKELKKIIYEG